MTEPTAGSREWVAGVMEKVFEECRALRGAGQKEYAHRDSNAFANFERVAERLGISREAVLMVYAEKHLDGIHSFIQGHRSQRESVTGRINDVIVYLILLRGMVEQATLAGKDVKPKPDPISHIEAVVRLAESLGRIESDLTPREQGMLEKLKQPLAARDPGQCSVSRGLPAPDPGQSSVVGRAGLRDSPVVLSDPPRDLPGMHDLRARRQGGRQVTPEKTKEAFRKIDDLLVTRFGPFASCRLDEGGRACLAAILSLDRKIAHLRFIAAEGPKLVDEGRIEKAMRHLGWLQGTLWGLSVCSIEDLMNMNRPDEPSVPEETEQKRLASLPKRSG